MIAKTLLEDACPEKRLLVYCARTQVCPEMAQKIRDLGTGPLDWDYFLLQAAENSILPLASRHLLANAPDVLPLPFVERMKAASRQSAVRCLLLTAELIKIVQHLQAEGIFAIPYKGPLIAAQAYGDVALREYDDLDIILAQRDLPKACEVMLGLGYRAKFPWILPAHTSLVPGEYNFRNESQQILLELHTELTLRHFPVALNVNDFGERLVPVALSGHDIVTFSPEDALPALCIHGAKDFWERLSWIADISELIRAHPRLDWDHVARRAEAWKSQRMLRIGLALAAGILDLPLPPEVSKQVESDRVAGIVAADVARRLLSPELPSMNSFVRLKFRRRMVAGYISGWRYSMRLTLAPAEEDWEMLRLPHALSPFYVVLRPFRLLRKHGGLGSRSH